MAFVSPCKTISASTRYCVLSASSEKQLEGSIKRFAAKENPPIEKHRLAIACTIDVI